MKKINNTHQTPLERWREDLVHVRPLTHFIAENLDDVFCHSVKRTVRKDATVHWLGKCFEVHHHLVGNKVNLIINPHTQIVLRVESEFGDDCGPAHLIDRIKNNHRKRQRPKTEEKSLPSLHHSLVENIHKDYVNNNALSIQNTHEET